MAWSKKHEMGTSTMPTSIDEAADRLRAAGYSYGHHAAVNRDGGELCYTVFAHRDGHRIIEHRMTLADAYEAAAKHLR
jgi:hypothetical protein